MTFLKVRLNDIFFFKGNFVICQIFVTTVTEFFKDCVQFYLTSLTQTVNEKSCLFALTNEPPKKKLLSECVGKEYTMYKELTDKRL